ncbi:acyltransferase family protein [Bradyrhizobium sp. URHC0002]
MQYRREIDGLRAVAVVPVILFHAGFQIFRGGFVGVDIFFVISGYLITTIILGDMKDGRFSLLNFYERRMRRILPALFVMLAVTLPLAWLFLFPSDLKRFAQSLVAVSGFASNLLFWRTSGYFEESAELKPLLHTWSLAVEEQYYVLFPLFLLLAWRLGLRNIASLLVVVALGSLAYCQWGSVHQPDAAFYLLPSRAWELIIGALAAVYLFTRPAPRMGTLAGDIAGMAGIAMIAYSIFVFEKGDLPGLRALVPTAGAALIILFASPRNMAGRVLASPVPVAIGLISYSAYLWHQPLFAFARVGRMNEPAVWVMASLALLSLALAAVSQKYVEVPFRNKTVFARRQIFTYAGVGTVLFVGLGVLGHLADGFESRLTPEQRTVLAFKSYPYRDVYLEGTCFLTPEQDTFAHECKGTGGTVIWGDSHAAALSFGLRETLGDVTQYTASACPPFMGLDISDRPNCRKVNDFVLEQIRRLPSAQVFLHADWLHYRDLNPPAKLVATIDAIKRLAPAAVVTVVGSVPQWPSGLPAHLASQRVELDGTYFLRLPTMQELRALDRSIAVAVASKALFLSPLDLLCDNGKCQATTTYGGGVVVTAWDYGHLTKGGSLLLSRKIFEREDFIAHLDPP